MQILRYAQDDSDATVAHTCRCLKSSRHRRTIASLGGFSRDELGLLYLALLNAVVLWAAWRVARRRSGDTLDAAGEALLLFYLVQYLSVCVPGILRALH